LKYFMHGVDKDAIEESFGILQERNFDAVVVPFDQGMIDMAQEYGLEPYVFSGTYSIAEEFNDDRYLSEDVYGNKHIWFGSTCPNKVSVCEYNIEEIKRMSSEKGVRGIFLDGARFSSPCSSSDFNSLFTCFCSDCQQKAESLGFDFKQMRQDVKKLYDLINNEGRAGVNSWVNALLGGFDMICFFQSFPGVLDWLNFRRVCTTEHIIAVSKAVKKSKEGNLMALYIFTPSLAGLVGQSYSDLRKYVDIFSPMIYRAYLQGEGPACLNTELARFAEKFMLGLSIDSKEAVKFVSYLTGLDLRGYETPEDIKKGLPTSCIEKETAKARALLGRESMLVPIIQLDDNSLSSSIKAVKDAGADGVNFFLYNKELLGTVKDIREV
jgi:hypothetical protein